MGYPQSRSFRCCACGLADPIALVAVALICTVSEIHSVLMLARSPKSFSSHKPSNVLELSNTSLAVLRRYPLRPGAGLKRTGDILFAQHWFTANTCNFSIGKAHIQGACLLHAGAHWQAIPPFWLY